MDASIEQFIKLSEAHASVDYENPQSVQASNKAADSIIELTALFVKEDRFEDLIALLEHELAGPWVAFSVADIKNVIPEHKERCIELIRVIAEGGSIEATGAQFWLRERGYERS